MLRNLEERYTHVVAFRASLAPFGHLCYSLITVKLAVLVLMSLIGTDALQNGNILTVDVAAGLDEVLAGFNILKIRH